MAAWGPATIWRRISTPCPSSICFLADDPYQADDGRIEANIVGARGCPYDCSFCGAAVSANPETTIRTRTPTNGRGILGYGLAFSNETIASPEKEARAGLGRFADGVEAVAESSAPFRLRCVQAVNPNGQWAWIEQETGQPIAAAIADALIGVEGACPNPTRRASCGERSSPN